MFSLVQYSINVEKYTFKNIFNVELLGNFENLSLLCQQISSKITRI